MAEASGSLSDLCHIVIRSSLSVSTTDDLLFALPTDRAVLRRLVHSSLVGRPIEVKQNPNPSKAELEEVQKRYIAELERIWNQWKDAYAANRTKELTIID